jgi:hypothetical protein
MYEMARRARVGRVEGAMMSVLVWWEKEIQLPRKHSRVIGKKASDIVGYICLASCGGFCLSH